MTKAPVYIHVGYPKTATTWLQVRVFPAHSGISYQNADAVFGELLRSTAPETRIRGEVDALRSRTELPVLFSLEALIGMFLPSPAEGNDHRNPHDIATSLKRIVPDAHILITIREQADLIESTYLHYIFGGYTAPPKQAMSDQAWNDAFLDFDRLVQTYEDLFGAEKVWVGVYEELKARPLAFLDSLFGFMGVQPVDLEPSALTARDNVGTSTFMFWLTRTFNSVWPNRLQMKPSWNAFSLRTFKRLDKLLGGRKPGSRWRTEGVIDVSAYAAGNRALNRKRQLHLEDYGYRL